MLPLVPGGTGHQRRLKEIASLETKAQALLDDVAARSGGADGADKGAEMWGRWARVSEWRLLLAGSAHTRVFFGTGRGPPRSALACSVPPRAASTACHAEPPFCASPDAAASSGGASVNRADPEPSQANQSQSQIQAKACGRRYQKALGRLREEKRAAKALREQLAEERGFVADSVLAKLGLPCVVGEHIAQHSALV